MVTANEPSGSRIAAVVNKSIISQSDLMNRLKLALVTSGLASSPEMMEKLRPQMLRTMIDEQLQLQEAKRYKIEVGDKEVKLTIKHIEESNGMKEGTIAELMKQNNIPLNTLENQIRANLNWVQLMREKYIPTLQIADAEIDQEMKTLETKETKTQYHLAEILLAFDSPDQEERVKADLSRLIEELQKGAHFTALAQQFSAAPTASQGGDMGWLTDDQLAPEIKESLTHMNPGQLSQPIRTSQGYVILAFIEQKLPGSEGGALLTMQQALLPFPKEVDEQKAQSILELASEISKTSKSCPDLVKVAQARFPGTQTHLTEKKQMSGLPEPLQKVLQALEIGKASEPFLTDDGALIIMVCEKEAAEVKKVTLEDARNFLVDRKISLLARRDLRDLRKHAFIEMRM